MEAARWRKGRGGDCNDCREGAHSLDMLPRDCSRCGFPGLWPENLGAWEVVTATGPALIDGMGGIRLETARVMCKALGRPWDRAMALKVLALAGAWIEKD